MHRRLWRKWDYKGPILSSSLGNSPIYRVPQFKPRCHVVAPMDNVILQKEYLATNRKPIRWKSKRSVTHRRAQETVVLSPCQGGFNPSSYSFFPSPTPMGGMVNKFNDDEGVVEPQTSSTPLVALVGRPNVGKSSLFNRLVGQSKSLVTPVAGTTRDRVYGETEFEGWHYLVVDTGGLLGDTDDWSVDIQIQAEIAIGEADLVLLIVDYHEGLTVKEKNIATLLRRKKKKVILVVNKFDNPDLFEKRDEYSRLGFGEPMYASAIHALGEVDILLAMMEACEEIGFEPTGIHPEKKKKLKKVMSEENAIVNDGEGLGEAARDHELEERVNASKETQVSEVRMALVGKPNVGKSSFLNKIVGSSRSVVSPTPGTTADPIDEQFVWNYGENNEMKVTLVDTAGMKKKKYQEKNSIIHLSSLWALKVVVRCQIAILLIDSTEGITKQDSHIAKFIAENYRSSLIVFNKWDLVLDHRNHNSVIDGTSKSDFEKAAREYLPELSYSPVLFISAKSGYKINDVIDKAVEIALKRRCKISTKLLMRWLRATQLMRPPPSVKGKRMKIKMIMQADMGAPSFVMFVNRPELASDEYDRFLKSRLREDFPTLEGSPIRLMYRKNERTTKERDDEEGASVVNKKGVVVVGGNRSEDLQKGSGNGTRKGSNSKGRAKGNSSKGRAKGNGKGFGKAADKVRKM